MDYKYIEQLLERYWNCETTLEEEDILRTFFSQKEVPAHLLRYRSLFTYEQTIKKAKLSDDFDEKILKLIESEEAPVKARTISFTQRLRPLFKAAAVIAILLTLGNAAQHSQLCGGRLATCAVGHTRLTVARHLLHAGLRPGCIFKPLCI